MGIKHQYQLESEWQDIDNPNLKQAQDFLRIYCSALHGVCIFFRLNGGKIDCTKMTPDQVAHLARNPNASCGNASVNGVPGFVGIDIRGFTPSLPSGEVIH